MRDAHSRPRVLTHLHDYVEGVEVLRVGRARHDVHDLDDVVVAACTVHRGEAMGRDQEGGGEGEQVGMD